MNIKDLVTESFETAKSKGWHDKPASFGDRIALIHSEASEALEAYRVLDGTACDAIREELYESPGNGPTRLPCGIVGFDDSGNAVSKLYKPIGVWSELADIVIRVADLCGLYGIDLDKALEAKMAYNKTRSYRHGGKQL